MDSALANSCKVLRVKWIWRPRWALQHPWAWGWELMMTGSAEEIPQMNGGGVVQKFANGMEVTPPSNYANILQAVQNFSAPYNGRVCGKRRCAIAYLSKLVSGY